MFGEPNLLHVASDTLSPARRSWPGTARAAPRSGTRSPARWGREVRSPRLPSSPVLADQSMISILAPKRSHPDVLGILSRAACGGRAPRPGSPRRISRRGAVPGEEDEHLVPEARSAAEPDHQRNIRAVLRTSLSCGEWRKPRAGRRLPPDGRIKSGLKPRLSSIEIRCPQLSRRSRRFTQARGVEDRPRTAGRVGA